MYVPLLFVSLLLPNLRPIFTVYQVGTISESDLLCLQFSSLVCSSGCQAVLDQFTGHLNLYISSPLAYVVLQKIFSLLSILEYSWSSFIITLSLTSFYLHRKQKTSLVRSFKSRLGALQAPDTSTSCLTAPNTGTPMSQLEHLHSNGNLGSQQWSFEFLDNTSFSIFSGSIGILIGQPSQPPDFNILSRDNHELNTILTRKAAMSKGKVSI